MRATGIFEREGWPRGTAASARSHSRGQRAQGRAAVHVRLGGNDGTFSRAAAVTLPLGTPVPVTIAIAPATAGVHTAILTLDHPGSPGVEYRTQATIVAAEQLTEANTYKLEQKLEVPRRG